MSVAMLEHTKQDIENAYKTKNLLNIGKETLYAFHQVVHTMLSNCKDRLKGITFETHAIDFDQDYLLSRQNKEQLMKTIQLAEQMTYPVSDVDFGKMKIDVERWYYKFGGGEMYFEYRDDYLMTPKRAAEILGVSNVTLNKYMKQGLEAVDTTSHNKIPTHAVVLWKDPVYSIRMQMLTQEKRLQKQTIEDELNEVREEIIDMQKQYKAKTVREAMDKYNIKNIDMMDDPADFRTWEDLEVEETKILEELIGGKEDD